MCSRLRENVEYFYECFCEVSEGTKGPYIIRRYPESYKTEEEFKSVPMFTFPCELDKTFIQHFSFVLTSDDSKLTFGFCRHDPNTSSALVVISHLPWHSIFYKFLNAIASLTKISWTELKEFLGACRVPPPPTGHILSVSYNSGQNVFDYHSPDFQLPKIGDNCNLNEYFNALDHKCMVGLWAALLNERRIVVVASKPARLSGTVQAANSTLYPMYWQHIYIPILPKKLSDYLLAPMPFLIGVPRTVMEGVQAEDIGDVVIIDADKRFIHSPFNDVETLPFEVVTGLKRSLRDKNVAFEDSVSRAFLRALVRLIGGYRDALRIEQGKRITFNPDAFLKTRRTTMRPFLKKMLQLQIFQQFIEERLKLLNAGLGFSDEFELECTLYSERSSEGMKQQYREWVKTMRSQSGALLKTVKDKANPAVKSAVNSVREGGRGVKSAVQGLKMRMMEGSSSGHNKNNWRPSTAKVNFGDRQTHEYLNTASSEGSSVSLESLSSPDKPTSWDLSNVINEVDILLSTKQDEAIPKPLEAVSVDKNITLPPLPPRPTIYGIVPTTKLIDITEAPIPPPRSNVDHRNKAPTFVCHITRNMENINSITLKSRGPMHLMQSDNGNTKLTATSSLQPGIGLATHKKNVPDKPPRPSRKSIELPIINPPGKIKTNLEITTQPSITLQNKKVVQENLIFLDEPLSGNFDGLKPLTPTAKPITTVGLDDFDPLQRSILHSPNHTSSLNAMKSPGDSDLLKEYGLDFSQYGLESSKSNNKSKQSVTNQKGNWTVFQ